MHKHNIPDSEKLVYLQSALKDGTANGVIEGLTRSGEFYSETIESLCARYDRPRLIHQTHVNMIMDVPALKDGNGKEIRRLHDTVQQHLRALKALGNEPSGPFITSMLELKLDTNTAFEWHKYSQDSEEVPHYAKLLEFLNLRAQASETPNAETKRNPRNDIPPSKKSNNYGSGGQRPHFTSLASNVADHACVVCKERHPLYVCSQFKSFNRDRRLSSNVLLMTCRVLVVAPDGSTVNARALLDSGSTVSFVSERLAQALRLPRSQQQAMIYGVAGLAHRSSVQSIGTFVI